MNPQSCYDLRHQAQGWWWCYDDAPIHRDAVAATDVVVLVCCGFVLGVILACLILLSRPPREPA